MPGLALKIVPPFQVLFLGGIMWLIHRYFPIAHVHTGYNFLVSRILLYLTVNPRKIEQTSTLITRGVYAWSRNPIYVVDVLLLLAWAIWLGTWINLALPLVFIWFVTRFQIVPEEAMLLQKFGDEYSQYNRRTRRWI